VVVVVGGPQYRAGSHRQFTLLARALAAAGIPCLRFDLRGMGDSTGPRRGFEHAEADIRAAIDALCGAQPQVRKVVLWGLCDGATACSFYAPSDPRVAGVALFNPWVRTQAGAAAATLRTYYGARVLERQFWRKLLAGRVDVREAAGGAMHTLWTALQGRDAASGAGAAGTSGDGASVAGTSSGGASTDGANGGSARGGSEDRSGATLALPQRLAQALERYSGALLVVLSGRDTVAEEFRQAARGHAALAAALAPARTTWHEVPDADHTFSSGPLRATAEQLTIGWLHATFGCARFAPPKAGDVFTA
jgi:pimeloyl-ACP methyl ester carboxylesterase